MLYFFRRFRLRLVWSWRGVRRTRASEHSFRTWVRANLVSGAVALTFPISVA